MLLEKIPSEKQDRSFYFFKRNELAFKPFWHYHPEIELTLITKGEGVRYVGDSIQPYKENDLVLIGSNLPHQWVSSNSSVSPEHEAFVFQFKTDLWRQFPEMKGLLSFLESARYGLHFREPSKALLEKIRSIDGRPSIETLLVFWDVLVELYKSEVVTKLSDNFLIPSSQHRKLATITDYILDHITEKISILEMSKLANLQPESFCRWFKKHVGMTFVTFVNRARVENAAQHLIASKLSITDVAFQSGFETLGHFNRTFKKFKQKTPLEFRNDF